MRISYLSLILLPLLCGSCHRDQAPDSKRTPLVGVAGQYLYYEDLLSVLPANLSQDDSLRFAEKYIRNWVEDVLLYDKAQSNIPNSEEIDQLVENYRKSLIMHAYQQALIHQKLADDITETEMRAYYDQNRNLFKLERPLIKGLFIKIPLTAPRINRVRQWYKDERQTAVEQLEKYQMQHAVKYEYFYDKWIPLSDMLALLPLKVEQPETYFANRRHVELKDTAYYYFLNISDYRPAGEQQPYETARQQIKDILLNMKQVEFMRNVKDELYEKAVNNHAVKYY